MENYIVGIGEILWDMLPDGKQLGGAPANFAYHVCKLGLPSKVVSAVGRDVLGDEILNVFHTKGIPSWVQRVERPTGTVQVALDEAGVPSYEIKTDVAWDVIPYDSELAQLAQHTKVVCFGSLAQRCEVSRNTIYRFLDAMPQADDVLKIFDINLRQQFYTAEILHESLRRCNVLKINDEELERVCELFHLEVVGNGVNGEACRGDAFQQEICMTLLNQYQLKYVILTCGEQGSFVFTSSLQSHFVTPKVAVADTVGAGDAFTAAFVAGILQGKSISESHQLAVDISAYVCTCHGAMPPYPADFK